MAALTIARNASNGAHLLEFEGITVRSDVLDVLQATVATAMTAPELARLRNRSSGATTKTLQRFAELGLVHERTKRVMLAGKFGPREVTLNAYVATDRAKRLLEAARNLETDLQAFEDDADPELSWPHVEPDTVVRQALLSQPNSVFDMGRLFLASMQDTPPKVAEPPRKMPANSVWALAAA